VRVWRDTPLRIFVPKHLHAFRRMSEEQNLRLLDAPREFRVLTQASVPGMYGSRLVVQRSFDEHLDVLVWIAIWWGGITRLFCEQGHLSSWIGESVRPDRCRRQWM
jgi:hypothetical protein